VIVVAVATIRPVNAVNSFEFNDIFKQNIDNTGRVILKTFTYSY